MNYSYEDIMTCVGKLGVQKTFSLAMLETLLAYRDADEKVLYSLILLFGDKAFTDEALEILRHD